MSQIRRVITTVINEVQMVAIYPETIHHIIRNHPEIGRNAELPSILHAIETTLTNPSRVERSYNNSFVFVDQNSTNASGEPLRVPVKLVVGTSARMKSAYFASTQGSRDVIWTRTDG